MSHILKFYIDGTWTDPVISKTFPVVDPSTEATFEQISLGSKEDVAKAVAAAKKAFETFSVSDTESRLNLLSRVIEVYKKRSKDLAAALSREMGAPLKFAYTNQVGAGLAHLIQARATLSNFEFQRKKGGNLVVKEPIGVVGMITPWNWPLNQITCKVAPALAAGCTMVLKPSEIAPLNAIIFAEILDEAGVPKGVFNLVNGDGASVGSALAEHPDVDMISITGSTRAGILVAKAAAETVKRVHQELGGKSANILLEDVDLKSAVTKGVAACFVNSGQSCNAPTRMFVPRTLHDEALEIAKVAAEKNRVGPANEESTTLGPVVSIDQYTKIQALIQRGIEEGASLVAGGPGRPTNASQGYFVQPTVFGNVTPDMTIAREEIFGPVLAIMPYDSVEQAIDMANDTVYGLAAYIQSKDLSKAREAARRMRTGSVYINYPAWDPSLPFGGYKQSGNGREQGEFGLEDFLEIKGISGYELASE